MNNVMSEMENVVQLQGNGHANISCILSPILILDRKY